MMLQFYRCLAVLALLFWAAAPALAGDLTGEQRRADDRLSRPVTYVAAEVYVGRLLEDLSKQTGVALAVGDPRDGAADFRVTVRLQQVPLGDALSALWSLMSFRGAEWDWTRSEVEGAFRYRLYRPQRARQFPDELPDLIEARFEECALRQIQLVLAPPKDRERIAGDDPVVRKLLESAGTEGGDRVWRAIRTFAENVPEARWLSVLRGETLRIPLDKLSAAGRGHVQAELDLKAKARARFGLPPSPTPSPNSIEFSRGGAPVYATPSLFLMLEDIGGYATFGGTPLGEEFNERMMRLWMHPQDKTTDPAEERPVTGQRPGLEGKAGLARPAPGEVPPSATGLLARLHQATGGAGVSSIALVPARSQDLGSPIGKTLRGFLDYARGVGPFPHRKWRHGVLLVTEPMWMYHARGNIPWVTMKQLRAAQQRNGGVLTFDDLLLIGELAPSQVEALGQTFPEASRAGEWLEFFLLLHDRPVLSRQLQRAPGVRAETLVPVVPHAVRSRLFQLGGSPNLRLSEEPHLNENPPWRRYDLVAYAQNGKRVGTVGTLILSTAREGEPEAVSPR